MKTKKYILSLLCLLSLFAISCNEKNPNEWEYDESYDRLFRTAYFTRPLLYPTYIQLRYFGVTGATKYVFEFSEGDSLEFTNIVRTDEILADTLIPYAAANSVVETEFRTMFENLKGTTRYSVRMKAVNENNGMQSGYSQLFFETPDEQIFYKWAYSVNKIMLFWNPKNNVTHIAYRKVSGATSTEEILQLNDEQKASGTATISGLLSGTPYLVQIFNNDARRGEITVKTLGIAPDIGRIVEVKAIDAASVNNILTECAAEGVTTLSLVFTDIGTAYEIGKITIPAGIDNLYFVGDIAEDGTMPELFVHRVEMSSPMSYISFQGVDLNARLNSSNYVFDIGNTNCFKNIRFSGCIIRNIGRSLVRPNNINLKIESIVVTDCIVQSVGISGYGMFNFGTDISLDLLSITNSTITELGSDRLMQLKGGVKEIVIDKCTFCNYTSKSSQIFRFDVKPGKITVTDCIFTGTNGGVKINSGNGDYSSYLEFYGCFLTSDFVVNTQKFTNATILNMTSDEMFADPRNGDFHLKAGVKFAGEGVVGDPRWW